MSSRSLTTTNLNSQVASNRSGPRASLSNVAGIAHSGRAGSGYVESGSAESRDAEFEQGAPLADDGLRIRQPYWGFLLLLVLLLAGGLRVYELGAESYSYDEGIMIEATSSGWDTVVANIARGRPPLIVLLGFGWTSLFGESEFAVRLLPALMGILSVGLLVRIGQTLKNDTVGLVAAFIMAISAFHLFHSQDYRYYSLLTLMTLASFTFYLKCFYHTLEARHALGSSALEGITSGASVSRASQSDAPRWIHLVLYVLFSAAVYYTHYQGVFVLVAQGLFFLCVWFRARNPLRWRWLLSQIVLGLLLVPSILNVLLDMVAGSEDGDFQGTVGALGNLGPLSDPPLWLPFHTLFIKFYFLSIENLLNWPYLLAAVVLLGAGLGVANRYSVSRNSSSGQVAVNHPLLNGPLLSRSRSILASPPLLILLGLWALCPVFIPYILSKVLSPMYLPRYTIGALPAVCLLLALLLVAMRRLLPLWASLGALAILALPGVTTYYAADFKGQWRIAAQHLQEQSRLDEHSPVDETIAFISVNNETADRIQLLFGHYLESETSAGSSEHSVLQAADVCVISAGLVGIDELGTQVRDCFSTRPRVWMVTRNAKEGPQQQIEASLLASVPPGWQMTDERRFSGVVVRLYEETIGTK